MMKQTRPNTRVATTTNLLFVVATITTTVTTNAFVPSCLPISSKLSSLSSSPARQSITGKRTTTEHVASSLPSSSHPKKFFYATDDTLIEPDQLPKVPVTNKQNNNEKEDENKRNKNIWEQFLSTVRGESENHHHHQQQHEPTTTTTTTTSVQSPPSHTEERETSSSSSSWESRYADAFTTATQTMTVKDLKSELYIRGISTTGLFDKDEYIKSYATAIADEIPIIPSKQERQEARTNNNNNNSRRKASTTNDETFDPSYRDVTTYPFNPFTELPTGDTVIDITLSTSPAV